MNDQVFICTECGKTGELSEFEYHEISPRTLGNHSNDWEESTGYYTCCKPHETLVEAVECKECGEHYGIGFKHTCSIEDAPADPNQPVYDRIAQDKNIHPAFRLIFQ